MLLTPAKTCGTRSDAEVESHIRWIVGLSHSGMLAMPMSGSGGGVGGAPRFREAGVIGENVGGLEGGGCAAVVALVDLARASD